MTEPHELTHAPDALRYYAVQWTSPEPWTKEHYASYTSDELEDYYAASEDERRYIEKKKGGKPR